MARSIQILGVSGSLRAGSRNTAVLRWLGESLPPDTTFELADISDLPLYNWDVEQEGLPESVQRLVAQVERADAVLFATPEYNYSITGPLKNAIDWMSRPPQSLWGKPVAMLGVAGRSGSIRSQLHLREILRYEEVNLVLRPEVLMVISDAFDGAEFVGERAQEQVLRLVDVLRARVLHVSSNTRRVLLVARDQRAISRGIRLLGEVLIDGVGAVTDDEAISQIESGCFVAVLIGNGVEESSRAVIKEVATASPEHPTVADVTDDSQLARIALDAVHG